MGLEAMNETFNERYIYMKIRINFSTNDMADLLHTT